MKSNQEKFFEMQEKLEGMIKVYLIMDKKDGYRVVGKLMCRYTKNKMGYMAHVGFCMFYYEDKDPIFKYEQAGGDGDDKVDQFFQRIFRGEGGKKQIKEILGV